MFFKLFLLFTVIPLIELTILVKVAMHIGVLYTMAIVIGTAAVGSYLVRLEGLGVVTRFQRNMAHGVFPADELIEGAMILIAGALLVTPGVLTDIVGFTLVFPVTRSIIKAWLKRYIRSRTSRVTIYRP